MTTPPDLEALAKIVTGEQFLAAAKANNPGTSIAHLLKYSPYAEKKRAENQEIERIAIPLYRADLASIPHYAQWDDRAWSTYLGSRWVEVCERVAAHLAGLPWPPEA